MCSKEVPKPLLTDMLNNIINTKIISVQCTDSNFILFFQNHHKIESYLLISLMSKTLKIFLKRTEKTLDEHQTIKQTEFRKDSLGGFTYYIAFIWFK